MNIREDAITTSLAVPWKSAPLPWVWSFRTDAETRTSPEILDAKVASDLFAAVATLVARILVGRDWAPALALGAEPESARPEVERLLVAVRETLREPLDEDARRRATDLVGRLAAELARMDLAGLLEIQATVGGDGAFLIEWTNGRRRIGLNVEQQAAQSSWYFVSLEPVASASGTMAELDLPALLRRLAQR